MAWDRKQQKVPASVSCVVHSNTPAHRICFEEVHAAGYIHNVEWLLLYDDAAAASHLGVVG